MSYTSPENDNVDLQRTQNAFESFHLLVSISALECFTGLIFNLYQAHTDVCSGGAGATHLPGSWKVKFL